MSRLMTMAITHRITGRIYSKTLCLSPPWSGKVQILIWSKLSKAIRHVILRESMWWNMIWMEAIRCCNCRVGRRTMTDTWVQIETSYRHKNISHQVNSTQREIFHQTWEFLLCRISNLMAIIWARVSIRCCLWFHIRTHWEISLRNPWSNTTSRPKKPQHWSLINSTTSLRIWKWQPCLKSSWWWKITSGGECSDNRISKTRRTHSRKNKDKSNLIGSRNYNN